MLIETRLAYFDKLLDSIAMHVSALRPGARGVLSRGRRAVPLLSLAEACRDAQVDKQIRPISPRLSVLRFVDPTFPDNYLWTREFHPLNLRVCLSHTL